MTQPKKNIVIKGYTYYSYRYGKEIHVKSYTRRNPLYFESVTEYNRIKREATEQRVREAAQKKVQLTVSTALYCGSKVQLFEKVGIFANELLARAAVESITREIIRENRAHCGGIPESVNYRLDTI